MVLLVIILHEVARLWIITVVSNGTYCAQLQAFSAEACSNYQFEQMLWTISFLVWCFDSFYTFPPSNGVLNCSVVQSAQFQLDGFIAFGLMYMSLTFFSSYTGNKLAIWNISRDLPESRRNLLGSGPRTCYDISDKAHPSASAWHLGSGKFYLLVTHHWIFDFLLDFSPFLVLSIVPLKKKTVTFQHPCLYSYIKGFSLLYILKHNPTNYIKKQHKFVMFVDSIPVIQHLIQLENYILAFKNQKFTYSSVLI